MQTGQSEEPSEANSKNQVHPIEGVNQKEW